jgi:hypothetical protein
MERYGFGVVIRDYSHTPIKAVALAGVALVRLNGWSLGWPVSLAGPALWLARGRPHREIVMPWAAVALATLLYQMGYPTVGTSETGALYHYAALPFIAFATAAVVCQAEIDRVPALIRAGMLASMLLGTTTFYVEHALRLSRLASAIEGPRRGLDLPTPAVVFEETWGGLRPQVGWVFGIPFRERSPSDPIVRYPRPSRAAALRHLMERWGYRQCRYLWYDWRAAQYRLTGCDEIGAHDGESDPLSRAAHPELGDDGKPWFASGRWREAFSYLPLPRSQD